MFFGGYWVVSFEKRAFLCTGDKGIKEKNGHSKQDKGTSETTSFLFMLWFHITLICLIVCDDVFVCACVTPLGNTDMTLTTSQKRLQPGKITRHDLGVSIASIFYFSSLFRRNAALESALSVVSTTAAVFCYSIEANRRPVMLYKSLFTRRKKRRSFRRILFDTFGWGRPFPLFKQKVPVSRRAQ